jgi:hypothetical protein
MSGTKFFDQEEVSWKFLRAALLKSEANSWPKALLSGGFLGS